MNQSLTVLMIAVSLFCSCKRVGLEQEVDPNGLYTPYLTSVRNDVQVVLKWGKPACAFCGGCPCPELKPDHFEILFSETGTSDLKTYSTVSANVFEASINNLVNGKPYYFAIKAVISGKKYTRSAPIMVIPDTPENISPLFPTIDKNTQYGSWSPDRLSVAYDGDYFWNNGNNLARSVFVHISKKKDSDLIAKNAGSPEWSPLGNRIVFQTDDGEVSNPQGHRPSHIAVYDLDANTSLRLTKGDSFNFLPSWSPDGDWVAYLSDQAKGKEFNIWKIASTGGTPIQVTSDFDDLGELAITADRSPKTLSWSKDGKNIAFSRSTKSGQVVNKDIYSVSSYGGEKTEMVSSPWNDYCPAYSPDGKAVAFISDRSGSAEIWTMDLQTKKLKQVTGSTGKLIYENSGRIEWSKSGDKILFTGNADNFSTLYLVDVR